MERYLVEGGTRGRVLSEHALEQILELFGYLRKLRPELVPLALAEFLIFLCIDDVIDSLGREAFHSHGKQHNCECKDICLLSVKRELLFTNLWGTVEL